MGAAIDPYQIEQGYIAIIDSCLTCQARIRQRKLTP